MAGSESDRAAIAIKRQPEQTIQSSYGLCIDEPGWFLLEIEVWVPQFLPSGSSGMQHLLVLLKFWKGCRFLGFWADTGL